MVKKEQFEYTVRILFKLIGIDEGSIVFPVIGGNVAKFKNQVILFSILDDSETEELLDGNLKPSMYRINGINKEVPVFVPHESNESIDGIFIDIDIITLSFYLLSRKEEVNKPHDQFGRFRFENSLGCKYRIIDYPIVDYYALILAERLNLNIPNSHYETHSLLLTHDVDSLKRFDGLIGSIKSILGGDIFLRKNIKLALSSLKDLFQVIMGKPDPEICGLVELLNKSIEYNYYSEFYFKGIRMEDKGNKYDISTIPTTFFDRLKKEHYAIGFHGEIGSSTNEIQFASEKSYVERKININSIDCGRQHYLSFDALKTPAIWEMNGIKYDSTLGFCDREGFMCGTCHEYPLYDLIHDKQLKVIERPLLVMDCTLRDYRKMTMTEALDVLLRYAEIVKQVKGQFVILWHNGCTYRDWSDWYKNVYCAFLREYHKRFC